MRYENATCKNCGKAIQRHVEKGWSNGWYHSELYGWIKCKVAAK